jgi:hypothetical protein
MVSLWDTLSLLSGAAAFGGAMGMAKFAGGSSAMRIGILVGIAWGVGSILTVRKVGDRLLERASRHEAEGRPSERFLVAAYVLAFAWPFGAGISGFLLAKAAIRLAASL